MNKLQQQTIHLPHKPGCYLFKDATGVVLYVGKAKDLRKRTSQYFGQDKRPQLPFLIEDASSIDYIVAQSELEALFLENTLIKKHNPKYNIKLKDDKNYAFIVIDYSTQIPQIGYARKLEDTKYSQTFVNPSANWGSGKREHKIKNTLSLRGRFETKQSRTSTDKKIATSMTPRNDKLSRKAEYFGPYSSTKKIRETLDFVRRIFPYCANTEVTGRPCFYYHLHRCPGVCVGTVSLEEYEQTLRRIKLFLNGRTAEIKKELKATMEQAARHKRFELAARLRDQLRALEILDEHQIAQFPTKVNYDLVSLGTQSNLYCVNLFKVRNGKLTDKENFVYTKLSTSPNPRPNASGGQVSLVQLRQGFVGSAKRRGINTDSNSNSVVVSSGPSPFQGEARRGERTTTIESQITQTFFETYYADSTDLPEKIFTQYPPVELSLISQLLQTRQNRKIDITVPHRGKAMELIKLGHINAEEHLRKQLESDASNIDKLNEALDKLQTILNLPTRPHRIECYDMSNTQGTNPVGSMVVFIDGKPAKSEYRKFKIRSKDTPDDFAMMRETLVRRFSHLSEAEPTSPNLSLKRRGTNADNSNSSIEVSSGSSPFQGEVRRGENLRLTSHSSHLTSWPRPDLIVIDGGKGQLSAALEAQELVKSEKGIVNSKDQNSSLPTIPMIGLAKRIEEIFLPNNPEPIILSHDEPALQMLQRLRDEAHRFGITFHRSLRSKQATKSALDTIAGIGPKTKKLLKQKFGTIAQIKNVSLDELAQVVGQQKAEIIKKNL